MARLGTRLQAAAQSGLAFAQNLFDVERYDELRRIDNGASPNARPTIQRREQSIRRLLVGQLRLGKTQSTGTIPRPRDLRSLIR